MKNILLLLILIVAINVNAQYVRGYKYNDPLRDSNWKTPQLYIPTTTLVCTFTTLEVCGKNLTYNQRTSIALSGIATSITTYLLLKKFKHKKHKI